MLKCLPAASKADSYTVGRIGRPVCRKVGELGIKIQFFQECGFENEILKMYFVYAISSKEHNYIYVGLTSDIVARIKRHNDGRERTTRFYKPFELIYSETCKTRSEARKERNLFEIWHRKRETAFYPRFFLINAQVAELVDALDSKSSSFGSEGSIPSLSTILSRNYFIYRVLRFYH